MNYFEQVRRRTIPELVADSERIFAHVGEGGRKRDEAACEPSGAMKWETLEEHTALCELYFVTLVEMKCLEPVFQRMEAAFLDGFSEQARRLFRTMLYHVPILHDLGKINPYFQKKRMRNDLGISMNCSLNTHHSMASSLLYINEFELEADALEEHEIPVLCDFMLLNAYVISRHHGRLDSFQRFLQRIREPGPFEQAEGYHLLGECRVLLESCYRNELILTSADFGPNGFIGFEEAEAERRYTREQKVFRMFYVRLMLSLLVACDYYATSEFGSGIRHKNFGNLEIAPFDAGYRQDPVHQSIRTYQRERDHNAEGLNEVKEINVLRNELFLEAEETLQKHLQEDIFYLEAPTGSGKSNVALNLSFRLMEQDPSKKKILYVYPFNTLVEQNVQNLEKCFGGNETLMGQISVINSVTPICREGAETGKRSAGCGPEEWEERLPLEYYQEALLNRQFLNHPIVLTTHVSLFRFLFGAGKEDVFALHQLANCVIVLDEIQSYRNSIWSEIITFLSSFVKLLNSKVIIMSATLPDLDFLAVNSGKTVRLIRDREKYFLHPLFRDRVKLDFSLLASECIQRQLLEHVLEQMASQPNKKILVEFISKVHALEFYKDLKEAAEARGQGAHRLELMTGDDNTMEREQVLERVKADSELGIILVATQVVEAGVDIDMDIGYKNISLFDSEEQFLGRINRSCRRHGLVFFFFWDQAKSIYKNDVRTNVELTVMQEEMRTLLENKDFPGYYALVLERLKQIGDLCSEQNVEEFFDREVGQLQFGQIEQRMQLIEPDQERVSVFLCRTVVDRKGETLSGEAVWNEYCRLLRDETMDYAQRQVRLSGVRAQMAIFTYQVRSNLTFPYEERIGDLFFIREGERFFVDGKFDRSRFEEQVGLFI